MALPVTVPNQFATATASIPLSQLDTNFDTLANAINGISDGSESLANVAIAGGTIDNVAISNVTITSGNVTITNVTCTTANVTTGNITTVNATTVDTTNIEVTNIKAKDGTAAASIADSTGKVTITTELAVDNLNLSGNTLSTTDTDGDLILSPDGDGVVQEEVGGTNYNLASQYDIGTAPNEIPLNQYLGDVAYLDSTGFVIQPQASAAPVGLGDMVFQLTSNTSLEIKVKGSDGTVRSVALTLA